jgi:MFS family permease
MQMAASPGPTAPARVRGGVRATYVAFVGSGFAFASWAARIPQVRDRLSLSPAQLGLLLLCIAGGSVLALPLSGPVVHRYGPGRTVASMAVLLGAALAAVAIGYRLGVVPVAAGLFVLGFANGAWDVAMNVHGAAVERELARSIMPRFHAGYSVGTVGGALLGAAMVGLGVPVTGHLVLVAVGVGAVVAWSSKAFLAVEASPDADDAGPGALSAWREPRTVLIGVFVLAFAFAEGAGNDWIGVAVVDGYHAPAAVGTLTFAAFLGAMTVGRWFGPGLLDRHGRVPVVRWLAIVGIAGSLLFAFAPFVALACVGAVLWGAGVALGFPVGMSAGADEPRRAAGRVSVIASIGYCAFLGGPPAVGFMGARVTVVHALVIVTALLVLAALLAPVTADRRR